MDSYHLANGSVGQLNGNMIHSKLEAYKVDEGYSEDTRSDNGSESSMRLDLQRGSDEIMQTSPVANLEDIMRGLPEYERGEIAYDLLRGLRASSIARIFDRLWPLFHKDPLEAFPPELMSLVLSYLEPPDLLTISLVSRAWRDRVTDSNLWRTKFSVEGWGLDGAEIARLEKTFHRPISSQQERRSGHRHSSSTYSEKQNFSAEPSHWSQSFDMGQAWLSPTLETEPRANNEVIGDREMTDADDEIPQSDSQDTTRHSQNQMPDRMQISPPSIVDFRTALRHARQPLIITSPPGYARINYHYIFKQKRRLEDNWDKGRYKNFQLPHRSAPHEAHEECVYTIQYQGNYLVSGSRDRTLRIWDLTTGRLVRKPLKGHVGSVLCLQFDSRPEEDIIVSGSSDTNVILWRFSTGEMIKRLSEAHKESVLNLRFDHRFLVTCSKDKTIKIWNRHQLRPGDPDYPQKGIPGGGDCPAYIIDAPSLTGSVRYQPSNPNHLMDLEPYMHLMTLDLHGAAVNAIQIYKDQLVSASGDRNLRVWNIHTGECTSKIQAHEKGIACVQYDGKRIVSGSSDNSIRIWDPATKTEVARLESHSRLVRTLQAAFADVPGGQDKLEAEAAEVDRQWHLARENGEDLRPGRPGRPARPGSRRPRDLRALGAKIPPSGGGSRWARIISGSYDEKVIIWKKNADDEWVVSHQLAQEEALTAAGPPLFTRTQVNMGPQMDDLAAPALQPRGPANTNQRQPRSNATITNYPLHPPLSLAPLPINQNPSTIPPTAQIPPNSTQDSQNSNVSNPAPGALHAMSSAQKTQKSLSDSRPQRPPGPPTLDQQAAPQAPQQTTPMASPGPVVLQNTPRAPVGGFHAQIHNRPPIPPPLAPAPAPPQPPQQQQQPQPQHNGAPPAGQPNARVFKLQFDARRIVCCSQDNKIVGWDFANGDEDIITCTKFFADPQ